MLDKAVAEKLDLRGVWLTPDRDALAVRSAWESKSPDIKAWRLGNPLFLAVVDDLRLGNPTRSLYLLRRVKFHNPATWNAFARVAHLNYIHDRMSDEQFRFVATLWELSSWDSMTVDPAFGAYKALRKLPHSFKACFVLQGNS